MCIRDRFCRYLSAKGCDHLYIQRADEELRSFLGPLFTDGLEKWFGGETCLYRVIETEEGMRFAPLEMEATQ